MTDIDYKQQDRQALTNYLKQQNGEFDVAHALTDSGVNKLRFWPLLFELEQEGIVEVTKRTELGTPEKLRCKGMR